MTKKRREFKIDFPDINTNIDVHLFKQNATLFFKDVPDPRTGDNRTYSLIELIVIILLAVFSGANTIVDIYDYAEQKSNLLRDLFGPEFGPPSYGTFWWILTRMNPQAFANAFNEWTKTGPLTSLEGEQLNLDGKSLRGACNKKGKCNIHIVHAYVHGKGLLVGQQKTEEKSNEITAIPLLLQQFDILGAVISIDAAGCQKSIVKAIVQGGGDYLLAVKDNQPKLYDEITHLFESAHKEDNFDYVSNCDRYESVEKKSGRIVKQNIVCIGETSDLSTASKWENLQTLIEVTNETTAKGKVTREKCYYISSLIESAKEFGKRVRGHWSVESMHWTLDVTFKEDASRANTLHAAVNLGTVRRATINIKNSDPELKALGMAKLRRKAQWSEDGRVVMKMIDVLLKAKDFIF